MQSYSTRPFYRLYNLTFDIPHHTEFDTFDEAQKVLERLNSEFGGQYCIQYIPSPPGVKSNYCVQVIPSGTKFVTYITVDLTDKTEIRSLASSLQKRLGCSGRVYALARPRFIALNGDHFDAIVGTNMLEEYLS